MPPSRSPEDNNWRILVTPQQSAAYNMAVDEALFNTYRNNPSSPVLRLYSWRPVAVSIGYGQDLNAEVDPAACRNFGIDIVRRMTGGRTVLHDEELTYSLIISDDHPFVAGSGYTLYRQIGEIIILFLQKWGIHGRFAGGGQKRPSLNGACFSEAARDEITVLGKKIAGSAQKRFGAFILQQGSLLLGPGHKRLSFLLPPGLHHHRSDMIVELNRRTVSLSEITGRTVSFTEVVDGFLDTLSENTNLSLSISELTKFENRDADALVRNKYAHSDWTIDRKQACPILPSQ